MNWTVSVAHTNANISVIIKLAASQRASSVTERKTVWMPLTKPTAVSSVFFFFFFLWYIKTSMQMTSVMIGLFACGMCNSLICAV